MSEDNLTPKIVFIINISYRHFFLTRKAGVLKISTIMVLKLMSFGVHWIHNILIWGLVGEKNSDTFCKVKIKSNVIDGKIIYKK